MNSATITKLVQELPVATKEQIHPVMKEATVCNLLNAALEELGGNGTPEGKEVWIVKGNFLGELDEQESQEQVDMTGFIDTYVTEVLVPSLANVYG